MVVLLLLFIPISSSKTVDIPGVERGSLIGEDVPSEPLQEIGVTRYVYAGNNLVASQVGNDIKYYHQDRLGSNRLITDSSGNEDGEFLSLPFGQPVVDEVEYGFTGKEQDSSGLHYFGARYYDSNLGRFTSRDPVLSELPYAYVSNNPMNFIDPSGAIREYAIQKGDDLTKISERFDTSVDELVKLNNLQDPNLIKVGQMIRLPDFSLSKSSESRLSTVDSDLAKVIREAQKDSPFEFQIVEGKRTRTRQSDLYKKARKWVGKGQTQDPTANNVHLWVPIKTNSKGRCVGCVTWTLSSKHFSGKAVDLVEVDSKGNFDWNYPHYKEISAHIKATAKRMGITIEWGGDWKDDRDIPHWQVK